MTKFLNSEQINELADWLVCKGLDDVNILRDFSDGVRVAQLIKQWQPALIELHNYPSCNCFKNKMTNWTWLNTKVLSKCGLGQKNQALEALARGDMEWTAKLLYGVMANERGSAEPGQVSMKNYEKLGPGYECLVKDMREAAIQQRVDNIEKRVIDMKIECQQVHANAWMLMKANIQRTLQ